MFRIKICGIQTSKDAQIVALAGADAVGLNFYSASPRYVDPSVAETFAGAISPKLAKVGLFVNSSSEEILDVSRRTGLHWVQLHGDETPEQLSTLAGHSVIKAFRIGEAGWEPVYTWLQAARELGTPPAAVLVDGFRPGEFGGTGQTVDWSSVAAAREKLAGFPIILAGGLTPFNVAEAIAAARPDAVDVASGVESKPGVKDLMLLRAFIMGAKKAFDSLASA